MLPFAGFKNKVSVMTSTASQKSAARLPNLGAPTRYSLCFAALAGVFVAILIGAQAGRIGLQTLPDALLSVKLMPHMAGLYLLGAALYGVYAVRNRTWLAEAGGMFVTLASALAAALVVTTSWESYQVLEAGHIAITNMYEVSILLLGVVGFAAQVLIRQTRHQGLGIFVAPLLVTGALFTLWLGDIGQAGPRHLMPALRSYWLPMHVLANFVGYGCFAVAAAAGAMQLLRARTDAKGRTARLLPAQTVAEEITFRAIAVGFPIFSLAIVLGSAWAYEAWGGYWSWDPKETWALIVWLVYGGYLHARLTHGWKGARLAWWAIAGFGVTLFCYLGVNMMLSGLHSYGKLM